MSPTLAARRGRSTSPTVTLRKSGGNQRCVAFNASLTLQARLDDFGHIGLYYDAKKRELTFHLLADDRFNDEPAHRIQPDGGGKPAGRALYVHAETLPEGTFATGSYVADLGRKKFTISLR